MCEPRMRGRSTAGLAGRGDAVRGPTPTGPPREAIVEQAEDVVRGSVLGGAAQDPPLPPRASHAGSLTGPPGEPRLDLGMVVPEPGCDVKGRAEPAGPSATEQGRRSISPDSGSTNISDRHPGANS